MGFNPVTAIGNLLGGDILDSVNSGIKSIWGSRQERDQQGYALNAANQSEYAAEFQFRENRTWWDSLIDGLNRLPRPVMALGTIALFVWCVADPPAFSVAMQAMALIPDNLWIILGVIVAFFFGDRTIKGIQANKGPSPDQVRQVLQSQEAIRSAALQDPSADGAAARIAPSALKNVTVQVSKPVESDAAYRADMADGASPLDNATILEWNRRQRQSTVQP